VFPLATPVALSRCATCGLVFQQTPALVEFAQAESCYAERNLAHRRELRPELLAQARRRLQWLRRYVSAGARVLEVGGATGEFAFEATRLGWHVTLLELSAPFVAEARAVYGLDARRELLTAESFPPGTFDGIVLFHLLEHLPRPGDFLDSAWRLLRPRGILALIVPNLDSITDRIFRRWATSLRMPDHLFHFNAATLRRLLNSHGYEVIDLVTAEPPHHLWTSTYALGGLVRRAYSGSRGSGSSPMDQVSERVSLARLPFTLARLTAPLTWFYRRWADATGRGHEVLCVARRREPSRA